MENINQLVITATKYIKENEENLNNLKTAILAIDNIITNNETKEEKQNEIPEPEPNYGFHITDKQYNSIIQWQQIHNSICHPNRQPTAIGGQFSFEFTPTSLGAIGTCYCDSCRKTAFAISDGNIEKYRNYMKYRNAEYEFQNELF